MSTKRKHESDDEEKPLKHTGVLSNDEGSDDDASSDGDECGNDNIYDATDEPFPIHAAFDPGLKHATATASKLVKEAHDILKPQASRSTTLQNMQKNAEEALVPPKSEPPMIAFVGPAGEGKSSAGNAILGVKGLMRTGSAGSSVTNVATIYQWAFAGQKLKYAAKILYRSPDESRVVLEDMLTCYNQNSAGVDEACSKEEKAEYEMHSQEAIKIFAGMFGGKAGFRDRAQTEKTLEDQIGSDGALLVEKMVSWCKEYFAKLEKSEGVSCVYIESETPTELEDAMRKFTSNSVKSQEPAWWPLVQEVRVGTSESRFLEFVRLVDLPGHSDTNPIRSRSADDNLRRCQGLYLFVDVKRAIDDPNPYRIISLYADRFPSTLIFVSTKTDQGVDDALLGDMREAGQDMTEYDRLAAQLSRLQSELGKATKKASGPGKKSAEVRYRLLQRVQDIGEEVTATENKKFRELVMARNNNTTKRLLEEKRQYFACEEDLRIVYISPAHYEVHTSTARPCCPLMDVEATGIPKLRDVALMMAGPPLWKAQTEYLESQVSVFIHGLRLWSAGCAAQDRSQLLQIVQELLYEGANLPLDGVVAKREEIMEKGLLRRLRASRQKSREGALERLKQLENWKSRSWIAFYRHSGQHTTRDRGTISWNEMFLESQTHETLDKFWQEMVNRLGGTFSDSMKEVFTAIADTKKKLLLSPATVSLDKTVIEGLFKALMNGIHNDYDRIVENCKQSTLGIKLDATKDRNKSYFTIAMQPGYAVGKDDRGDGVTARCRTHLRKHLTLPLYSPQEPFAIHHQMLAKALKEDSRKHTNDLQACIQARTIEIYRQFESATEQKPETPAEASARKAIKPFLKRALRDIEQNEKVLEQIRKKYPAS